MTSRRLDLNTWARADTYSHFRRFERPHFATTVRLDVTKLMQRKAREPLSPFRAILWAAGSGINAAEALRLRFDDEGVMQYDDVLLSGPIDMPDDTFRFCYIPWERDFGSFDSKAAALIQETRDATGFNPTPPAGNAFFFSCLPWIDFTSIDNALEGPDDCVPRLSWGKIVEQGDRYEVAMAIHVHHALVDGRDVGIFFNATQDALNTL